MTAVLSATAPATTTSRVRPARAALWALQIVLAGIYVASAVGKVTLDPATVAGFAAMGFSAAGCVTIGALELLGAAALLVPRLAGAAATALVALMVGATTAMAAIGGGVLVAIPASVLVLVAVVAVARRSETARLVREVGRVAGLVRR